MPTALVAGHVCMDFFPSLGGVPTVQPGVLTEVGPMRLAPGGCVAGTASALMALGIHARLAANVGDDELGPIVASSLAASGAQTNLIRAVASSSTSYSVVIEPAQTDRTFWHHVGANACFDGADLDLRDADLLHVGYPSLLPALCANNARPLVSLLDQAIGRDLTTSLDLATLDPRSEAASWDWQQILDRVLPLTGLLTPSADDLTGVLTADRIVSRTAALEAARELVRRGAAVVMVTCGADGLVVVTDSQSRLAASGAALRRVAETWANRTLEVAAADVPVVTTTGAGDAATAGLLAGLLQGHSLDNAATLAVAAAAARLGGMPLPDATASFSATA